MFDALIVFVLMWFGVLILLIVTGSDSLLYFKDRVKLSNENFERFLEDLKFPFTIYLHIYRNPEWRMQFLPPPKKFVQYWLSRIFWGGVNLIYLFLIIESIFRDPYIPALYAVLSAFYAYWLLKARQLGSNMTEFK